MPVSNCVRVGIVGGGFVGKATAGFASTSTTVLIYDLQPHLRSPSEVCIEDIYDCDVVFVSVPTPMSNDGSCHINIVKRVVKDLQTHGTKHIVIRSTVPIGTSDDLKTHFMPEFLTEKNWFDDFRECSNWIVGVNESCPENEEFQEIMRTVIQNARQDEKILHDSVHFCTPKEAETLKYFRNCFLATKVAFCNEMYRLCESHEISYDHISTMVALDPRIGSSHMTVPGHDGRFGFGGTCFPKDLSSLIHQFHVQNVPCPLLETAQRRNLEMDRPEQDWKHDQGRAVV